MNTEFDPASLHCVNETCEAMPPSRQPIHALFRAHSWLWVLVCLIGVTGCGPASSNNSENLELSSSIGGRPPVSEQGPKSHNDHALGTPKLSLPFPSRSPAGQGQARPEETLKVPDVQGRLNALDAWGQYAPQGSVDALLLALEDENEQIQERALELIEQDWLLGQAANPPAERSASHRQGTSVSSP